MSNLVLRAGRSGLLVVDFQERLIRAMQPERVEQATRSSVILLEAARRLRLPVVVSEQYPAGLGQTIAPIATALAALDPPVTPLTKLHFSVLGDAGLRERIARAAIERSESERADADSLRGSERGVRGGQRPTRRVDAWIVVGMETHVCVYQTVRDLVASGCAVHVVADACLSRTDANWQRGLDLMSRAGAVVTSTEVVVFDLLERAGTDDFKALSKLVR